MTQENFTFTAAQRAEFVKFVEKEAVLSAPGKLAVYDVEGLPHFSIGQVPHNGGVGTIVDFSVPVVGLDEAADDIAVSRYHLRFPNKKERKAGKTAPRLDGLRESAVLDY